MTLKASAGFPLALPGTKRALTFRIENTSSGSATLDTITLQLPAGTSFVSATGQLGSPSLQGRKVTWTSAKALAQGRFTTLVASVRVGAAGPRLVFRTTINSTLADGRSVSVAGLSRVRVGRSLRLKVVGTNTRNPANGSVSLTYPRSALSLVGSATAQGIIRFGAAPAQIAVRLDRTHISAAAADTAVTARAVVISSNRPSCRTGSHVTVRLVDRDVRKPRTAPDLIRVVGSGCAIRPPGGVITS